MATTDVCAVITGPRLARGSFLVTTLDRPPADYLALRRATFAGVLGLFDGDDADDHDRDPATVTLVARDPAGDLLGGVRVFAPTGDTGLGWWRGGRLTVRPGAPAGVGTALVRAAVATAEGLGALRFDAEVLPANEAFFRRLGWVTVRPVDVHGRRHLLMSSPVERLRQLVAATKAPLGGLLADVVTAGPAGRAFRGDDAAPVGAGGVFASVDAIVPSMVERDPEWAGWCGVLVGANDLAAMGARGTGVLDALGSPDRVHAATVLRGVAAGARAFGLPVLGGHTQLGVPATLSVTAFGVADRPVRGGGGRAGDVVHLVADLGGGWRPGYTGRQWDSTSGRTREELAAMGSMVARTAPHAAKDVSMAGLVGTLGMLAEASGVGATVDVAAVPRPAGVSGGDWLTCFPGFGMLIADEPGRPPAAAGPARSAAVGRLDAGPTGVRLRWPDGEVTTVLGRDVTGLGRAA